MGFRGKALPRAPAQVASLATVLPPDSKLRHRLSDARQGRAHPSKQSLAAGPAARGEAGRAPHGEDLPPARVVARQGPSPRARGIGLERGRQPVAKPCHGVGRGKVLLDTGGELHGEARDGAGSPWQGFAAGPAARGKAAHWMELAARGKAKGPRRPGQGSVTGSAARGQALPRNRAPVASLRRGPSRPRQSFATRSMAMRCSWAGRPLKSLGGSGGRGNALSRARPHAAPRQGLGAAPSQGRAAAGSLARLCGPGHGKVLLWAACHAA
jgi:hypothetical protein